MSFFLTSVFFRKLKLTNDAKCVVKGGWNFKSGCLAALSFVDGIRVEVKYEGKIGNFLDNLTEKQKRIYSNYDIVTGFTKCSAYAMMWANGEEGEGYLAFESVASAGGSNGQWRITSNSGISKIGELKATMDGKPMYQYYTLIALRSTGKAHKYSSTINVSPSVVSAN